jgi:hypothetical protein
VPALHARSLHRVSQPGLHAHDELDEANLRLAFPLRTFAEAAAAEPEDGGAGQGGNAQPAEAETVGAGVGVGEGEGRAAEDEAVALFDSATLVILRFPNTIISLSPRLVAWIAVDPLGPSSSRVRIMAATWHRGCDDPAKAARDFEKILVGLDEDLEMAEQVQRGLAGAAARRDQGEALAPFRYGRLEGGNIAFVRAVERAWSIHESRMNISPA